MIFLKILSETILIFMEWGNRKPNKHYGLNFL